MLGQQSQGRRTLGRRVVRVVAGEMVLSWHTVVRVKGRKGNREGTEVPRNVVFTRSN